MTLVEVLISFIVMIVLSGGLFWILIAGKTIWQASAARSGNRQELQVSTWRIAQELRDSNLSTVTNNTGGTPSAFSFLSAYDSAGTFTLDGTGAPVWQKAVIYYVPQGTTRLLRREVFGAFTGPLSAAQLAAYCDGSGSLLSPSLTSLGLGTGAGAVTLSLSVEKSNGHGKLDRQSRQVAIHLRN